MEARERKALVRWYEANRRLLPWRVGCDPYAVWVSETMLQQTRAAQAAGYFERWMERFPTVFALASASEAEALAAWQGLGYYRRCRMLLAAARVCASCGFPCDLEGWRALPGVGRYTAGAVCSIALGMPEPVVDGNVERVFARFTGCSHSGPGLNRAAWEWADSVLDRRDPGRWNQALMELGATVCTPRSAGCSSCPLVGGCAAFASGRVSDLPALRERPSVLERRFLWVASVCGGRIGLRRFGPGEWWEGMWGLPEGSGGSRVGEVKFVVTRHRVRAEVLLDSSGSVGPGTRWFDVGSLEEVAIPTPHRRAICLALGG